MKLFLHMIALGFFIALYGCSDTDMQNLKDKATQTFQDALKDSNLKETIQNRTEKFNDFLENNATQIFIEEQAQMLQQGLKDSVKILEEIAESNTTKKLIQHQMENINDILNP